MPLENDLVKIVIISGTYKGQEKMAGSVLAEQLIDMKRAVKAEDFKPTMLNEKPVAKKRGRKPKVSPENGS